MRRPLDPSGAVVSHANGSLAGRGLWASVIALTASMNNHNRNNNKPPHGGDEANENKRNRSRNNTDTTGLEQVRENREVLKDLADSDLPCAWIADALLAAADDRNGGESRR